MADKEYIERNSLIAEIEANINTYWNEGNGGYYLAEDALNDSVKTAPTADVAPKSELAREIFEEIEKEIDLALSVTIKILNAKGCRANGKTILLSKYDVFIEAKKFIAKLEKKYTEGNP